MKKVFKKIFQLSLFILFLFFGPLTLSEITSNTEVAYAASLTALSDTMSRVKATVPSNHTIAFTTPGGVVAGQKIVITFPTGYSTTGVLFSDIDVSWGATTGTENELTLAATASGTTWGAAFSSQVLTITSGTGTITAASKVIIEIGTNAASGTNQIDNQTVAQNNTDPKILVETKTAANAVIDSGYIGTEIITEDQIAITATVDQALTFTVSNAALTFGTFPDTAVRWATNGGSGSTTEPAADNPTKITAFSNANGGFTITIAGTGDGSTAAGLYSTGAQTLIPAAGANSVTVASENYAVYAKNKAGSAGLTVAAGFNSGTSTGILTRSNQTLASTAGPTDSATFDLALKAAIKTTTPAGTYSDTLNLICTATY